MSGKKTRAHKESGFVRLNEAATVQKRGEITELNASLMKELVKEIRVYPDNAVQIIWNFANTLPA